MCSDGLIFSFSGSMESDQEVVEISTDNTSDDGANNWDPEPSVVVDREGFATVSNDKGEETRSEVTS